LFAWLAYWVGEVLRYTALVWKILVSFFGASHDDTNTIFTLSCTSRAPDGVRQSRALKRHRLSLAAKSKVMIAAPNYHNESLYHASMQSLASGSRHIISEDENNKRKVVMYLTDQSLGRGLHTHAPLLSSSRAKRATHPHTLLVPFACEVTDQVKN
jgi:hypothetical protein